MDDFNEDDLNEFEKTNERYQHFREMEKEMLKIDLTRGSVMPLTIKDWKDMFGEPTMEDLFDITQAYIKQYHDHGDEYVPILIDAYGISWVEYLLRYNEEVEEYELCSILKSHIDSYKETFDV
jgi:hypothetical protein